MKSKHTKAGKEAQVKRLQEQNIKARIEQGKDVLNSELRHAGLNFAFRFMATPDGIPRNANRNDVFELADAFTDYIMTGTWGENNEQVEQ